MWEEGLYITSQWTRDQPEGFRLAKSVLSFKTCVKNHFDRSYFILCVVVAVVVVTFNTTWIIRKA